MIAGAKRIETRIVPATGFRSAEVALKVAEITEVHEQFVRALKDLAPEQFAWQPAAGRNTIGMLVTHVGLVEVHLAQVGLVGERNGHVADVLGIGADDDGMPLATDAQPPAVLEGRAFGFFDTLLGKALAHTRAACAPLVDDVLGAEVTRPPRPDGSVRVFDRRWVLHHMVEHAAQHLGQIQVLKRHWPGPRG